jgi:cell division septation protein DedD
MKTIEEIILSLIQDQKRVFLTGVGQFSVERHSASIHPVTHEMTPPHSILEFSKAATGDDDQLINAVRVAHNISFEDAYEKVNQYLAIIRNTFSNTKSFSIDRVCTVKEVGQEAYIVIPFEGVVLDKNDIGLTDIKTTVQTAPKVTEVPQPVAPIPVVTPIPVSESKTEVIKPEPIIMEEQNIQNEPTQPEVPTQPEFTEEPKPAKKKNRKGVWIFIILLLFAIMGVVGYLFKDDIMTIMACKRAEVKTDTTSVVVQKTDSVVKEVLVTSDTAVTSEPAVVETEPVVEQPAVQQTVRKKVNTGEKADLSVVVYAPKDGGKYYVIAMSFKSIENASKGVKQLKRKGYNPVVIDKNEQGLYRVAYKPGYETERLARDFADELYEKQNLDPWIVKY